MTNTIEQVRDHFIAQRDEAEAAGDRGTQYAANAIAREAQTFLDGGIPQDDHVIILVENARFIDEEIGDALVAEVQAIYDAQWAEKAGWFRRETS